MSKVEITFLPEGRRVSVAAPVGVADAAAAADVLIDHPCGAKASCGKCRVRFVSGVPEACDAERRLLTDEEIGAGWRLSCQATVDHDAAVEVPEVSRAGSAKGFGDDKLFDGFAPRLRMVELTLPEPDLDHQWALEDSLGQEWPGSAGPEAGLEELAELWRAAEKDGGRVTVATADGHLLGAFSGHVSQKTGFYGIALDIGSTSVAGALVDLRTGSVAAQASILNPQVRFGGDVISRIFHAQTAADGNQELHLVLTAAINEIISRLAGAAGIGAPEQEVWAIEAVGNPAMLHTLVGADVTPLGQAPYVGLWTRAREIPAATLGLHIHPRGVVFMAPMIRSNVGADTVAAVVAAGADEADEICLMIDLGTNSEIVLGNRERLVTTSTAAGPAFEGANIQQGMRAAPGAVDRVSLRPGGGLAVRVIGGGLARGICGSGLIDAVAGLLRTGLIDATGRMHGRDALNTRKWPELVSRVVQGQVGHNRVILATPEESESGVPVMLSALDVRQLQLIKGSIHAGAVILMEEFGIGLDQVGRVLIAGAFGQFVRKSSALAIGLIPAVDAERVEFIGNAAGVGARMMLVDEKAARRAEKVRERAEYFELGAREDYQDAFAEAMGFQGSPALDPAAGTSYA